MDNDESRMTNVKGMSKSESPIKGHRSQPADSIFGNSGFFRHLSFVIRISTNVSRSPVTGRATKTVLAHAELHLARFHSARSDDRRLRPQAQRCRGWRD